MDVAQGLAGLGGRKKRNASDCLLGIQAKNQAPQIEPINSRTTPKEPFSSTQGHLPHLSKSRALQKT